MFVRVDSQYVVERVFSGNSAANLSLGATLSRGEIGGAVAVHGYCGLFGGIVAGFALWGYPAIYPSAGTLVALSEGAGWFGTNAEGLPIITPMGNTIVSLIFCIGFGFIPGYILGGILKAVGLLRVDPRVELTGLDGEVSASTYPNISGSEAAFEALQRKESKI